MGLDFDPTSAAQTTTVTVRTALSSAGAVNARGRLIVLSGASVGKLFTVEKDEVLGRGTDASIRLQGADLSRRHARIIPTESGEFAIQDLGSHNGTFVNGEPVDSGALRFGDAIQLGSSTVLLFTHYHTLEEQILQSQRMESIGRLAGGIAHDFNNLVGAVLSNLSVLESKLERSGDLECVRDSQLALQRASELTEQLLGFARRGKYAEQPTRVSAVVDEAVRLCRRTFDRAIRVAVEADPDLVVLGDHGQLLHVLVNLCLNARDAMPDGGVLTIRTYAAGSPPPTLMLGAEPHVCICVSDTGCGMDEETRERAFEPYFTTKSPKKGTGMGLATAYGIVANHRGSIEMESKVGEGTDVRVWLRRLPVEVPRSPRREDPRVVEPAGSPGGSILVVDDETVVRKAHARVLEMLGYETLGAEDGEEALAVYRGEKDRVQLVLLDLIMPGMRGEEVFRRLKEIDPQVKVIVLSGYVEDESIAHELRDEGVLAFLIKPCDTRTLHRAILDALAPSGDVG